MQRKPYVSGRSTCPPQLKRDSLGGGAGVHVTRSCIVLTALVSTACLGSTVAPRGKYTLDGTVGGRLEPGTDACVFGAWIPISGPLTHPWEGRVTLGVGRLMVRNGEPIKRDTNFANHWLRLVPQGSDTVLLSLVGPVTANLVAVRTDSFSFTGNWICDGQFPFADDSSRPNTWKWGLLTY